MTARFSSTVVLCMEERLIRERAAKGGSSDIHEKHLDYLKKCHAAYQELVALYGWKKISCVEEENLRSPDDISRDVKDAVLSMMGK